MILPPKKLKNFSYYTIEFRQDKLVDYHGTDIITLIYDGKSIFGKDKEIKKEYRFRRKKETDDGKEVWAATADLTQFTDQLSAIVKGEWEFIDKELLEILKQENPEYFLWKFID